MSTPEGLDDDTEIAIEPRSDNPRSEWPPPLITTPIAGKIRLTNVSSDLIPISRYQHIAQVRYTCEPSTFPHGNTTSLSPATTQTSKPGITHRLSSISIDPDKQLSPSEQNAFTSLHQTYQKVFDGSIGMYNDSFGTVRAYINMGTVEPPPQKARVPIYNRENMDLLQGKMDELINEGVLARPEDLDIEVEYVSPSFLIKKPGGGHRMVTAFNNIGQYTKPIPSKITTSNDVFQFLAQFKYIMKTDMTSQFFQLPIKTESIKYLGVISPYKGVLVYTRAAMGMPGSTECLDQLMYRLLGDLIHEGVVMKIADDLYVGGDDIHTLLHNWERVLRLFEQANLRLSPSKTVVCPITTTVLGWIWSAGSLSVSPHKVNPLTQCELPVTVKALRGWCGAAKHIKACIPQYSALLADFEKATAGKESREKVSWTEELKSSFKHAQEALANPKTITIPRRDDHLIITNDGAVRNGGIGSILYILRNGRMLLGGYYSAKLKPHHERWLPCEVEALAISSATNHWSTLILQSFHQTQILSDSRPCILAYEKLCRGEYSMSARVSTFLSTLSQYRVKLQHIAGSANLPADYLSRSAMECSHKNCQICKFVESENSVVMSVTVSDILSGKSRMPFTNSASWKQTQQDCPALRRVFAHLSQGTRPGKKATNIKDIKRYLKVATLGADGLLVVKSSMPFVATRSLIFVPGHVLAGFLTSLHLQLQHPVASQLQKIFDRHFYSLDSQKEIKTIVNGCAQCSALRSMPKEVLTFTSSQPPSSPGVGFACDIMCRAGQ